MKTGNLGFTLMELLIVIAILGVLSSVGLTSYFASMERSRDGRRQSDLKAMQNAMEQYYALNTTYDTGSDDTCETQLAPYLTAGVPDGPSADEVYIFDCTQSTYCICADLEDDETGNYGNSDCATTGVGFYCVKNLQ